MRFLKHLVFVLMHSMLFTPWVMASNCTYSTNSSSWHFDNDPYIHNLIIEKTSFGEPTGHIQAQYVLGGKFPYKGAMRIWVNGQSVALYRNSELREPIGIRYPYDANQGAINFWFHLDFKQNATIKIKHWSHEIGNFYDDWTIQVSCPTSSDTIQPAISINTPTSNNSYLTTHYSTTLSGSASDNQGVTRVAWRNDATGQQGNANISGSSWSASSIGLRVGENRIRVYAYDAAGNSHYDEIKITRHTTSSGDTQNPSITILTPSASSSYSTESTNIRLYGSTDDNQGVTSIIWTNYTTASSGYANRFGDDWLTSDIALDVGENEIRVYAYDTANNMGTDIIYVTRNISAPNQEPRYQSGSTTPINIAPNGNITFTSRWQDPEDDYIVDVKVRYRKLGEPWEEVVMDYAGGGGQPTFSKTVTITEGIGNYEYKFRASDAESQQPNAPRLNTTKWQQGGTFTVAHPTIPVAQAAARRNGSTLSTTSGHSNVNNPLLASHSGGNLAPNTCSEGDPIDTATGAQVVSYTLLSVQGVLPIDFTLRYNSLLLNPGIAGRGWDMNGINARLEPQGNGDVLIHWSANRQNLFNQNPDGSFQAVEIACRFDVLVKNTNGSYTLTRKDDTIFQFNAQGQLTELRNPASQSLQFSYDGQNRLSQITEPVSGVFLSYDYNSNNQLAAVSDSLGRHVSLSYDNNQHLTQITDAAGQITEHAYNPQGHLLTARTQSRLLFSNTYDDQGRVLTQDDGNPKNQLLRLDYTTTLEGHHITTVTTRSGHTREYVYDSEFRIIKTTDEQGRISETTYHADGKVASVMVYGVGTNRFSYNPQGKLLEIEDHYNYKTLMQYNAAGDLTQITNPLQQRTTFSYDNHRNLISFTNAEQQTTRYSYNAQGQVTQVESPSGRIRTIEYVNGLPVKFTQADTVQQLQYDAAGRVTQITDASGQVTILTYDNVNRLTQICAALNRCSRMTYNSDGQLLTFTDAKGNVTRREYNSTGQLVKQINALNQATQYHYDSEDRLVQIVDAQGRSTQLSYDTVGRLIRLTDALGHSQQVEYDAGGRVIKQIDALGEETEFDYGYPNHLESIDYPLGDNARFSHDALGYLESVTLPAQPRVEFTRDELNRVIAVQMAGKTSTQTFNADGERDTLQDPAGNTTHFDFDAAGRLLTTEIATGDKVQYRYKAGDLLEEVTNARGQIRSFSYDAAGRLESWNDPDGTVHITYDENDNVLTVTDATGTITREYDALDRIVKFTDVFGNVLQYRYDSVGNLVGLTYPDGKQVTYGYDNADRLVQVTDWANRTTTYAYDANDRLLHTAFANGDMLQRSYDALGRLIEQRTETASGEVVTQYEYTYDANGKIVSETFLPKPEIFTIERVEMTYGAANRLATYGEQTVQFDADGNLLTGPLNGGMTNFVYDSRNRLVQAGGVQYGYDAENRRVTVDGTRYVVNPLPALSQTLVRTAADGSQTFYVYGLGLIAEESAAGYRVYHFDLRGSTTVMTDASGAVVQQMQYGPYGALVRYSGEVVDTPFLYNGRDGVMTDGNGLYYMRARFYHPEIRRFVNQDVLLGFVGDGRSLNRYAYVSGEPVSFVDPFGLFGMESGVCYLDERLPVNYCYSNGEVYGEIDMKYASFQAGTQNSSLHLKVCAGGKIIEKLTNGHFAMTGCLSNEGISLELNAEIENGPISVEATIEENIEWGEVVRPVCRMGDYISEAEVFDNPFRLPNIDFSNLELNMSDIDLIEKINCALASQNCYSSWR